MTKQKSWRRESEENTKKITLKSSVAEPSSILLIISWTCKAPAVNKLALGWMDPEGIQLRKTCYPSCYSEVAHTRNCFCKKKRKEKMRSCLSHLNPDVDRYFWIKSSNHLSPRHPLGSVRLFASRTATPVQRTFTLHWVLKKHCILNIEISVFTVFQTSENSFEQQFSGEHWSAAEESWGEKEGTQQQQGLLFLQGRQTLQRRWKYSLYIVTTMITTMIKIRNIFRL